MQYIGTYFILLIICRIFFRLLVKSFFKEIETFGERIKRISDESAIIFFSQSFKVVWKILFFSIQEQFVIKLEDKTKIHYLNILDKLTYFLPLALIGWILLTGKTINWR